MRETASNFFYYPFEILLLLIFKPLFSDYFSIAIPAILFFYTCAGIIFYLKLKKLSLNTWLIIALKYLILLALTGLFYFLSPFYSAVIFGILFVILFILGYKERNNKGKLVRTRLLFGAIIVLIIPIVFIVTQSLFVPKNIKSIDKTDDQFNHFVLDQKVQYQEKLNLIAQDPTLNSYLQNNDYANLSIYAQNLMVSQKLSYFVITNNDGTVLVKAHSNGQIGDNLFKQIPKAAEVINDKDFFGLENTGEPNPYVVSGKVIKGNSSPLGAIYVGDFLNDNFFKNLPKENSYVLRVDGKFTSANENIIAKDIYSSNALDNFDTGKKNFGFITIGKSSYLFKQYNLSNDSNNVIANLLIAKEDKTFLPSLIVLLVLITVFVFIYIADLWPIAKIENIKLKHLDFVSITEKILFCLPILLICLLIGYKTANSLDKVNNSKTLTTDVKAVNKKIDQNLNLKIRTPYAKIGTPFKVELYANSSGVQAQSVVFELSFPINSIKANSIEISETYCKKTLTKNIDNAKGLVSLACELPGLNAINEPQKIGTVDFVGLSSGIAKLAIVRPDSYILTSLGSFSDIDSEVQQGQNVLIYNTK